MNDIILDNIICPNMWTRIVDYKNNNKIYPSFYDNKTKLSYYLINKNNIVKSKYNSVIFFKLELLISVKFAFVSKHEPNILKLPAVKLLVFFIIIFTT